MSGKRKTEEELLREAIDSAFSTFRGPEDGAERTRSEELRPPPSVRTELSATVFSGQAPSWVSYLQTTRSVRYDSGIGVLVSLHADLGMLAFQPENDDSGWLARLLDFQFRFLRKFLQKKPHVLEALDGLIFGNLDNRGAPLRVRLSSIVPSDGTRETARKSEDDGFVELVLNAMLVQRVRRALAESHGGATDEEGRLGLAWPILVRFIASLAYPTAPPDQFVTKIDVVARLLYVVINVLYEGRKGGKLVPNLAGRLYERWMARSSGLSCSELEERHPYFRAFHKLSFMLRARPYREYEEEARIVAREFLDTSYLRLSLAGVMPQVRAEMRPMPFTRTRHHVKTPSPKVGLYGILDGEDLEAWKQVADPFRDLGFMLLRQLGMGEFGRVYEALNQNNPSFPEYVALKVDRIVGKKKKAILEAEEAMNMGRVLASVPHIIRLYDAGKLSGRRYTYHVLQRIDGETLDDLIDITGKEHASVSRPSFSRRSELDARGEYLRAMTARGGEAWRRRGVESPFTEALSPAMSLDLVTSVLLWLEEVHQLGYASNDLKNGNLMMSRRGQVKGIDLDSYGIARTAEDQMADFMFLSVSLVLLLFNAPVKKRGRVPWEELVESENALRRSLHDEWPFGDVVAMSAGRVRPEELIDLFVDLVQRSRTLVYSRQPSLFSDDIVRLTDTKRRLLAEEFVID